MAERGRAKGDQQIRADSERFRVWTEVGVSGQLVHSPIEDHARLAIIGANHSAGMRQTPDGAALEPIGLIVVGGKRQSGAHATLTGSVAERLVAAAARSAVAVVPQGTASRANAGLPISICHRLRDAADRLQSQRTRST